VGKKVGENGVIKLNAGYSKYCRGITAKLNKLLFRDEYNKIFSQGCLIRLRLYPLNLTRVMPA
jgi:hypothetical protein